MNRIRRAGRRIALLAGLAAALLAAGTVPAFALQAPPAAGGGVFTPSPSAPVYVVGGGMPGWQIALIAVVAAVVAAIVAVRVDRARQLHRAEPMSPACDASTIQVP
jgi:hypothetical protein